jgi:16S rRNA (cytosine967-C5)-methyltransferase
MPTDLRANAARVIARVLAGASLNQALPPVLEQVADRDRGLLQQLCYGTLRDGPRLQGILDQMLDKPLRSRDGDVRALLLCGLYQLESTRIPDHAAVSATVAATRDLGKTWARGMTNALLRRYQREGPQLLAALDEAARHRHPEWLYQALHTQWPEQAHGIIAANNTQPPMTLRVNAARVSREGYQGRLVAVGIKARTGNLSPQALQLEQPRDVHQLPGFEDGLASVQDEAAQMAAILLQAKAGDRVLDACAAPGGKACHILELQPRLGGLVALDSDSQRLDRVRENLERLSLQALLVCADAASPPPELTPESFDRILVDAPCSATGVIRRHPDIKLLRREGDIALLAATQLRILQGVWPLLRPGGTLLYATCSVLAQENDHVIEAFMAGQEDACPTSLKVPWGQPTATGRQLLPTVEGPDGLFYALIHKSV